MTDRDALLAVLASMNDWLAAAPPPAPTAPSGTIIGIHQIADELAKIRMDTITLIGDEPGTSASDERDYLVRQLHVLATMATEEQERLAASRAETVPRVCVWSCNENHGNFDTGCGHCFEFITDGPAENHAAYCQYCGGALRVSPRSPGAKA